MEMDIGTEHVWIDGMVVERDALRIVEAIKDYDSNIEVLCVDPVRAANVSEEPFVIAERCKDGVLRPIFRCWELNELVLLRIHNADGTKFNQYQQLLDMEKMAADESQRRYKDKMAQSHDIAASVLVTPKSKYTVKCPRTGDMLTFYDDRPTERH